VVGSASIAYLQADKPHARFRLREEPLAYLDRWRTRAAPLRSSSMAILLVLLITLVFVLPVVVASNSVIGKIAQDVLLTLILLSGVVEASTNTKEFIIISLTALVVITVRWVGWLSPIGLSLPVRDIATLLSLVLLAVVIAMKVFGSHTVTKDRISGAIAFYILAGLVWADAYHLIVLYVPRAFAGISTLEGVLQLRYTYNRRIWRHCSRRTHCAIAFQSRSTDRPALSGYRACATGVATGSGWRLRSKRVLIPELPVSLRVGSRIGRSRDRFRREVARTGVARATKVTS
jgi:hypothetical protein